MFSQFPNHEEQQLIQSEHEHLPPQYQFATLTKTNQIKPVYYLAEQKFVLLSRKDDSHLILTDFTNDQFSLRISGKGDNIIIEPLVSFSSDAVKIFPSQKTKPIKRNTKTLPHFYATLNVNDFTVNDDPIKDRIPKDDNVFRPGSSLTPGLITKKTVTTSLIKHPSTSEKNDSEAKVRKTALTEKEKMKRIILRFIHF